MENSHEIRQGSEPARVILYMPESTEPFVVVKFAGLNGGQSAVQHFNTGHEAARWYLGVD